MPALGLSSCSGIGGVLQGQGEAAATWKHFAGPSAATLWLDAILTATRRSDTGTASKAIQLGRLRKSCPYAVPCRPTPKDIWLTLDWGCVVLVHGMERLLTSALGFRLVILLLFSCFGTLVKETLTLF